MEDLILTSGAIGGYIIGNQWFHINDGELFEHSIQLTRNWKIKSFRVLTNTKKHIIFIFNDDEYIGIYNRDEEFIYQLTCNGIGISYLKDVFKDIDNQLREYRTNEKSFSFDVIGETKDKMLAFCNNKKLLYNKADNVIIDISKNKKLEDEFTKEYCEEMFDKNNGE